MFLWQYFWMRLNWWTLSNADHSVWCGWVLSNQCKALLEQSDLPRGRRKYSSILGIFQLGIASLSWFSSLLTYSGDFGFNKLQKIVWDNTLKEISLPPFIHPVDSVCPENFTNKHLLHLGFYSAILMCPHRSLWKLLDLQVFYFLTDLLILSIIKIEVLKSPTIMSNPLFLPSILPVLPCVF